MRRWLVTPLATLVAVVAIGSGVAGAAPDELPMRPLQAAGESVRKLPPPVGDNPKPGPEQPPPPPPPPPPPQYPALPADSGSGRRIVYAIQQQRVWIVEGNEATVGSWLVSGRLNAPDPGTYSIYSRSRHSQSYNGSVTFEFMLRFTKASNGNAIGFHSIPVDRNGQPVQSEEELGQPRSRGCVRQKRSDAEYLWNWAPDGTTVRVTR